MSQEIKRTSQSMVEDTPSYAINSEFQVCEIKKNTWHAKQLI
jgi:hypothetical protein